MQAAKIKSIRAVVDSKHFAHSLFGGRFTRGELMKYKKPQVKTLVCRSVH
jgi:hypothetical protein